MQANLTIQERLKDLRVERGLTPEQLAEQTGLSKLDALHLSDDAIEVLKMGKCHHRLLSEMLCHKDFQRMMPDAEIYTE